MAKKFVLLLSIIILISSCSFGNSESDKEKTMDNKDPKNVVEKSTNKDVRENSNNDSPNKIMDESHDEKKEMIPKEDSESYTDKNGNDMSEEEFNNSWRAKAIESETDLWNFYDNTQVGLSLQYPLNTTLLWDDSYPESDGKIYMKINLKEIWEANDEAMSLTSEEEKENISTLSTWEFWENADFVFDDSKKVIPVWNTFAQDYFVLSRFDVCDVTLERTVLFYFNNKEIKITSYFPKSELQKLMPEIFIKDELNCWPDLMWDNSKQSDFYNALNEENAPEDIQMWFNDFNKMIETILITELD